MTQARSIKAKQVRERIDALEASCARARAFLRDGDHADWHGFRALFDRKERDGRALPPHPDWVRNVFLPRVERALRKAEKALERLEP